jgi:hypothetical protein
MRKWKVPYREYAGWKTRGRPASTGPFSDVHGIVIHHTGSDKGQSDDYLHFLFVEGRPADGLPGPLCHVSTDMDGDLWLGATGRANHAGKGSSTTLAHVMAEGYNGYGSELKPGADNVDGNAVYYGNEVRYDGGQPMTAKQYATAVRWAAAVCDFHGWSALSIIGHREWTRRKPDPGNCPMNKFRSDVAALLKAGPPKPTVTTPPKGTADMAATLDSIQSAVNGLRSEQSNRYAQDAKWVAEERAWRTNINEALADVKARLVRIEADTDKAV